MNETHVMQLLGSLDERRNYALPKDIAEVLIKMPKAPVVSEDEIDVGTNVAFLKGDLDTEFCLDDGVLYFVERASEMGGILAHTYLTPLVDVTLDYFNNLSDVDLAPLRERKCFRRAQQKTILAEHERLARAALKKLRPPEIGDAKRFIRLGKPDYNCARLQFIEHYRGENHIVDAWKTACNNIASAVLISEQQAELHMPQITPKKPSGGSRKTIDIAPILNQKAKPLPRLAPEKKVIEQLDSEVEIAEDFETGLPRCARNDEGALEEAEKTKVQDLVMDLLEEQVIIKSLPKAKNRVQQSRLAPVSLSPEREL